MRKPKLSISFIAFLPLIAVGFLHVPLAGNLGLIENANAAITQNSAIFKSTSDVVSAFSADGNLLAANESEIITVRDVTTGTVLWEQVDEANRRVGALAFSANGKMLASSGRKGVSLWNATSGKQLGFLGAQNNQSEISGIAFSSSGVLLAGKNAQNNLYIWNLKSGVAKVIQPGSAKKLAKVSFSPDEKFISVSYEEGKGTVTKILNPNNGKLHAEFINSSIIADQAYSPDSSILATADQDLVNLLEPSTGKRLQILKNEGEITAIALSADSQYLASASNGKIQIWNTRTGDLISTQATEDKGAIKTLLFNGDADNSLLAAIGEDHRISLYGVPSGEIKQVLNGQTDEIINSSFNNQKSLFAAVGADGLLTVWDLVTGVQKQSAFLNVQSASNSAVAFNTQNVGNAGTAAQQSPINSSDASALSANTAAKAAASIKNIASKSAAQILKKKIQSRNWKGVNALAVSADGLEMGVASDDGTIRIVKKDGKERWQVKGHHGGDIRSIAYRSKSKEWISAGRDTEVKLWSSSTGANVKTYFGLEHPPRAVVVSPDGKYIATAGEETRIFLYDADAGKLVRILSGHSDFVNGLAFGPKSNLIASAGAEGRIFIWDVSTGKSLHTLLGHSKDVNSVVFSPDGGLIASASEDSTVILWNAVTGQKIKTLTGHQGAVRSVAFSPNGKTLVSAGVDTKLLEWNPATGQLTKQQAGSTSAINFVVFNPNGDLHVADEKSEVSEIKIETGAKVQSITVPKAAATSADNGLSAISVADINHTKTSISEINGNNANQPIAVSIVNRLIDWLIPAANAALPTPPDGPILVVTSGNGAPTFGNYYAEILRAEGLNEFAVADISTITSASSLAAYDVVILSQMTLTPAQVTVFQNWVTSGGNLIAMRPDKQLASLLGLSDANSTLADAYLLVNTTGSPGNGIVAQTIQYHGLADRYTLNGATNVATLYSDANTSTANPAVTVRNVGTSGGQAAAFTYDLAMSIVYTHQGNPAWATQERDGLSPIRSDDKFYGNATGDPKADWIDLSKVAIPQADEQQRLLVNLILEINKDKKPLPRFWYLPRDLKAAVIMTGDDHANNGTEGRFNDFIAKSGAGCSVQDWECIRGTSYIFDNIDTISLTPAEAVGFNNLGFEVGLHINTNCADYTSAQLESFYAGQISNFISKYPGIPAPITQRHHCIAWSDWVTGAKVQLAHGIRFDTTYYFWPPSWVQNTPGLFSGTGMPMRFVDLDGSIIDVYQAASQMTDESGQTYPFTIDTLLDRAIGSEGYYGAYTINAHTDVATETESDTTVVSAQARNIPVITSRQMLDWLDCRSNSSFGSISRSGNTLSFTINPCPGIASANVPQGVKGLKAHLPFQSNAGVLSGITLNGSPVSYATTSIKGVAYASFTAAAGNYVATYSTDTTPPTVTSKSPADGSTNVSLAAVLSAGFSEPINPSTVNQGTFLLKDSSNNAINATVAYNSQTATLTPAVALSPSTTYTVTVKSGIADLSGNVLASDVIWTFTTGAQPCSTSCSGFNSTTTPPIVSDSGSVELGVKFKSDIAGYIKGVRFYNTLSPTTGAFTGSLWDLAGNLKATGNVTSTNGGWRQVDFAQPVAIAANTVYVASYHVPSATGGYAATNGGFTTAIDNVPLHFSQDGANGGNGVYAYNASSVFPTNTYQATNYWVDVVFTTNVAPDTTPPTVTGQTPAANATGVAANATVTVTFNEGMDSATINTNTIELRGPAPANILIPATVAYNAGTRTATLTPSSALSNSTQYTVTVKGGGTDPRVKDAAGNAMAANYSWSFTTGAASSGGCSGATESIWPSNPTPSIISDADSVSVELGVKFRSSVNGLVCGIRFYKGSANTGTHVGKLYTSSGTLLASVTFTGETASGWQSINFATPVAITAGTQYVASYLAPVGKYSANSNYFSAGTTSGSLYAFSNAESGGNGVYQYGTGGFPSSTFGATNYWVDVIFTSNTGPDTTAPTVTSTSPAASATGVIPTNPVSVTFNEPMNAATITSAKFTLAPAVSGLVLNYDAATRTASLTPATNTPLASNTTYTATVIGGASGVTDVAGNPLTANFTWTFTTGVDPCSTGGNAIVCENAKAGNPSSEWEVGGGSTNIEGFTTDISVNRGNNIQFKVDSKLANYHLDIYRMGYYNGLGARKVATIATHAGVSQPACLNQASTGLIDCGNWTATDTWGVPATAASGIYFAKATIDSGANTGQASHVFFIVRDDASTSDILFQTSDASWHAYNDYGGNNLYTGSPAGRAYKVSYNRPFRTRTYEPETWVFNAEYPMVRWLEANGYNVSYFSQVDSVRFGNLIQNHRLWMSNGHDEYWSSEQRNSVEAARNAGVNLGFFSSNTMFWKTKWENNITDSSGTLGTIPYRTVTCYKETHTWPTNPNPTPNTWTGTWRDPSNSSADGGRPENALIGNIFRINGPFYEALKVPQADGLMRFWRNTAVASQTAGSTMTLAPGTVAAEVNVVEDNGFQPAGLIGLSTNPITTSTNYLLDNGSTYGAGNATHKMTMYRHSSGAIVFASGTYNWAWGLDSNHDLNSNGSTTDVNMKQATVNLFADMGIQPGNLQSGLVTSTASSDVALPSSQITSPATNASVAPNTTVNVTGTAADTGGRVAGVEVSVNGGSWHPASGRGSWTYSFTAPGTNGTLTIRSRAIDDSLNMENPGAGITINVGTGTDTTAPSVPASLVATVFSGTQVNLDWGDSTDNVAVTRYQLERCQGATCTTFAPIATPTLSAFNNTGLTEGVTYRYRVSAGDAANNFSGYSNIVTVTPDVTAPSAPTSLTANVISSSQINLTWVASTDNSGAIASYQVERCTGVSCTTFASVGTPTVTSFSNTALTANTTYRYRALAKDAAGNASVYSTIVSATTPAAPVAPTAVNDLFLYRSGVLRTANATGPLGRQGVLANDTDSLNLPLTAQLVGSLPAGVTLASNGVVTANISANTSLTYRANNGSLLSLPTTGATVSLRLNGNPTTAADSCSYSVLLGTVSGTPCVITATRVISMNLIANDSDPNVTTNIPTDGIGDAVTSAVIATVGTGVSVAANSACGQAALGTSTARASIVNNCNGTLTVTVSTTVLPSQTISFSYRAIDDLGGQTATNRTDTITLL